MCGGEPAWGVHEDIQIRALDPRERHLDTALLAPAPSTRHSQDLTCACTGMCLKCALDTWKTSPKQTFAHSKAKELKTQDLSDMWTRLCPACDRGCALNVPYMCFGYLENVTQTLLLIPWPNTLKRKICPMYVPDCALPVPWIAVDARERRLLALLPFSLWVSEWVVLTPHREI